MALTSVALTWSLTMPALIAMALTSALRQDLTIPTAMNVTDMCNSDMETGSDKMQKAALTSAGSG